MMWAVADAKGILYRGYETKQSAERVVSRVSTYNEYARKFWFVIRTEEPDDDSKKN